MKFKSFSQNDYLEDFSKVSWYELFICEEPEEAAIIMTRKLTEILNHHAPVKTFQIRKNFTPWLSEEIKKFIKDRNEEQHQA